MKQYTVKVTIRGCGTPINIVFSGYEAYQQWLSGTDIHALGKINGAGNTVEVIIPRHAVSGIELTTSEAESTPIADAFCKTE